MQIKSVEDKVRLVDVEVIIAAGNGESRRQGLGLVDLTVEQAEMLRPDLGPAVRMGRGKSPETDYLKLALDQARAFGKEAVQKKINELEAQLRELRAKLRP